MDGVIIINKPKGISSNEVIQRVRKILQIKQVGHCGTLDPLATGVLPILVGQGTKVSKYMVEHDKTYIATIQLGTKTTTADGEGEILQKQGVSNITEDEICNCLITFKGEQMQIPPIYSAIKKNGKKLYEYARKGENVEIEARKIFIHEIKLLKWESKLKQIVFEVKCSKGTYIRSLCEDIAERLGTIGFMNDLIRTKVNKFRIEDSITIEEIEKSPNSIRIISIEELFNGSEKIILDNSALNYFLNGVMLTNNRHDDVYRIYNNDKFIGLGIIKDGLLKRDVIV